jgi:hypothetical protein
MYFLLKKNMIQGKIFFDSKDVVQKSSPRILQKHTAARIDFTKKNIVPLLNDAYNSAKQYLNWKSKLTS